MFTKCWSIQDTWKVNLEKAERMWVRQPTVSQMILTSLGACGVQGIVHVGEHLAKGVFDLDSGNAAGLQAMLSKVFSNFQWKSRTPTVLFQGDCLCFWCFSASQHHDWIFPVASGNVTETQDTDLCTMVYSNCGGILLYHSDGLSLCVQLSQGYDCTHCCVAFKVVLCMFSWNLIDVSSNALV